MFHFDNLGKNIADSQLIFQQHGNFLPPIVCNRPILTYAFFLLFAAVKIAGLHTMVTVDGIALAVALPLIWDAETQALFAAVMAFWFGQRALGKSR